MNVQTVSTVIVGGIGFFSMLAVTLEFLNGWRRNVLQLLCISGVFACWFGPQPQLSYAADTVVVGFLVAILTNIVSRQKRQAESERQREMDGRVARERYVMDQSISSTLSEFEQIIAGLRRAERHLDQADTDFIERAFSPFWQSIQRTVESLGDVDGRLKKVRDYAITYESGRSELQKLVGTADAADIPTFPLPQKTYGYLTVATRLSDRMSEVVRRAQTDFQFATIYEQYKTNAILVAGFESLATALEGLREDIVQSIGEVTTSVSSLYASVSSATADMREIKSTEARETARMDSERASRERQILQELESMSDLLREAQN